MATRYSLTINANTVLASAVGVRVTADLTDSAGTPIPGVIDTGILVAGDETATDSSGNATLSLYATSAITRAGAQTAGGTYYTVTVGPKRFLITKAASTETLQASIATVITGSGGAATASELLDLIKTVDGSGSGLDADLLDGHDSAYFAAAADLTSETSRATAAEGLKLAKASDLSDLASASTARSNLGLGGAATLAVGTSAGTVAAGDDSRITGAAQKASNLSDLASASTARTNLGLGTAATTASTAYDSAGAAAAAQAAAVQRANHTGTQTASTISDFDTQVRTSRLDQMAAPSADVSLASHKLTNVTDPASAQDAATKTYADLKLAKASNLSDLASASTARTNLGLGTAATTASTDYDASGAAAAAQAAAVQRANHTGTQTMSTISDAGTLATLSTVDSAHITDGTIVNADVNAAAGIALTKLATDPLARANHTGTQTMSTISDAGTLATLNAVASAQITDGTIVDGDVSGSAALALTKMASIADQRLVGNVSGGSAAASALTATQAKTMLAIASTDVSGLGTLATKSAVASSDITDGTIVDGDINASAALALTKLASVADQRLLGNVSGSSAPASALTAAQAKTMLAVGISDVTSLQTNLDTINGVLDATRPLASGDSTVLRGNWSNAISTGTGNLRLTFFTARRTFTSTQLRLVSGGTAASATPTLVRAALYTVDVNGDGTRVATIASDTSIFAAANTEYLRSWQASYGLVAGVKYALGILVVTAGTAPTLPGETGQAPGDAAFARLPRMSGSLGSQSDVPSSFTHAGLSNFSGRFYAELVV